MEIKNTEQIVNELAGMLRLFDRDLNRYATDVYAYVNDGFAELRIFENVGGNSRLNDGHRVIYTDREHFEKPIEIFDTINDLAAAIGIPADDLTAKARAFYGIDDELSSDDIMHYADTELSDAVQTAYKQIIDYIDDDVYRTRAEQIVSDFADNLPDPNPIRAICAEYGLTQTALAKRFDIPLRTVQDWCGARRTPPPYVLAMMRELLSRSDSPQK